MSFFQSGRGYRSASTASHRGNRGRGGFAPRRGNYGTNASHEAVPDISLHPLGELVATLSNASLEAEAGLESKRETTSISDCEYIASYNWLSSKDPTIIVPGKPPKWTPLQEPRQLKEDSGEYFRDPNAARFPSYPIEPAVRAIFRQNELLSTDVHVFACGSTLGYLLRFVRKVDKRFRFDVEMIGNTLFIIRKENSPMELIPGIHGFGHTFPEANTTWEADVKGSESYQRLIQYHFGGLKCVVRFESDGYFAVPGSESVQRPKKDTSDPASISKALGATSVSHSRPSPQTKLTVLDAGAEVSQDSIFDLKTRSGRFKREVDMEQFLPVLWLKQIPNFITAYHNGRGLFPQEDIHVKDVRQEVQDWEERNREALKRFVILLRKIIDFAKKQQNGRLDVYSPSVDRLEIRKPHNGGTSALPEELKARWLGTFADDTSSDDDFEDGGIQLNEEEDAGNGYADVRGPDYTACSAECGYCGECSY